MKKNLIACSIFLALLSPASHAGELDEALKGFDEFDSASPAAGTDIPDLDESGFDSTTDSTVGQTSEILPVPDTDPGYSIGGYASFLSAYNYAQASSSTVATGDQPMDFSGLSRARIKGGLTLDMKHNDNWQSRLEVFAWYDTSWAIHGRDEYTSDVLDTYESFVDIKDAYIQGSLTPSLDLKFGRQLVIWGKSDSIRVTDIINPLDNRAPGMVDIEDLRLSETMTRLDYYFGDWGLSGIVIHEPRLEVEAAFGSDYRPSNVFGSPIPYSSFPDRKEPAWAIDNSQYAMSLDGHFSGWDLSFYAAHVYDSRFAIRVENNAPVRYYDKINMLGIATNMVSGSWLFKMESALITDINYRSTSPKKRLDILLGFDYMGIKDTSITLELANRHIFDYEDKMLSLTLQEAAAQNTFPDFVRQDSMQLALRASYSFDHDNATTNYLFSLSGGNGPGDSIDGGFQRLWIDYKYDDSISLSAGIVDYIGGDSLIPFYRAIEDNDRIYAEIQYDF